MASSGLITCIQSTLEDLDLLFGRDYGCHAPEDRLWLARFLLRNIKMFVLSTRTFDNLETLLVQIEADVHGVAENLVNWDGSADSLGSRIDSGHIIKLIDPSLGAIDEWYLAMFDDQTPRLSASLTADQILEIITSCLVVLEEFQLASATSEILEPLKEKLMFSRSLVCLALRRSVVPVVDFLRHAEAVVIRAAYLLYPCIYEFHHEETNIKFERSTFLEKIKPIEEVHESYTQVLGSLKSRRPSSSLAPMDDGDSSSDAIMGILDYLISIMWKEKVLNSSCEFVNDQLWLLFTRLKSLRSVVKQQPAATRGMEIKENIVDVVCDVGALILSCYRTRTDVSVRLEDLLQMMRKILVKFGKDDSQVQKDNFPKTNQLGFVDFVREKLSKLTSCEPKQTWVQTIENELAHLRSFLEEIVDLRNKRRDLQTLWDRVLEVTSRVEEDLIDHPLVGDLPDPFLKLASDFIMEDIMNIKKDVLKTSNDDRGEMGSEEAAESSYQVPSQNTL